MSNSPSKMLKPAAVNMTSAKAHDPKHRPTDEGRSGPPATADTDIEMTDAQETDAQETDAQKTNAAETANSLFPTTQPSFESTTNSLAVINHRTPTSLFPTTFAPLPSIPVYKPASNVTSTAVQHTQPIPVMYPPRRPNIFKTRQKHVRFPVSGLSAVAPRTAGPTTEEMEEGDGFPVEDMEEFQKEICEKMKKKTDKFVNMVRENAWKQNRVEDLGELFAVED